MTRLPIPAISFLVALAASAAGAAANEVDRARLHDPAREPQNWLHHHKNYAAHRYSELDGINRTNVKALKLTWSFALGGSGGGGIYDFAGLEGTPVVADGFMYMTDGWGVVTKLDVRRGRGEFVWRMDPGTDKDWAGSVTCRGIDNRGVALWRDRVISHTLDGRLLATDQASGEIVWEAQVADPAVGETITAAPLIVEDLAITGVSGAEFGIRGWIAATDLTTGKARWKQHTIPAPGEAGGDSWQDDHEAYKTGGGSTWITGSYDPEQGLIYWGVGNPGPDWDREYRPGDNLYTNSAIALDARTGAIKFHFQFTPNDPFDYDGTNELILVDGLVGGQNRKAMLQANRNGYVYALDRLTGRFIYATPFVKEVTWTRGIDAATGRPLDYDPASPIQHYAGIAPSRKKPVSGKLCPANIGGKNWMPAAYSPKHHLMYIPVLESCNEVHTTVVEAGAYKPREWFTGGGLRPTWPVTGSVTALDVATGKIKMKTETRWPLLGGLLVTAGDLVFTSTADGDVVAFDATTLQELWRFPTGTAINAPPITYGVDGKQFVAIAAGLGGAMPKWWMDAVAGLEYLRPGAMLFVFSL